MKKYFLFFLSFFVFSLSCKKESTTEKQGTEQNESKSLEHLFLGIYEGTFPCASCPGIEVSLELFTDGTFKKMELYLESKTPPEIQEGTYLVDEKGHLVLSEKSGEKTYYKAENQSTIVLLDSKTFLPVNQYYTLKKQR